MRAAITSFFTARRLGFGAAVVVAAAAAGGFVLFKSKRMQEAAFQQSLGVRVQPDSSVPGVQQIALRPPGAGPAADGVPPMRIRVNFDEACLRPIRLKHFPEAIDGCSRFIDSKDKAGHAHSALAAIYATRSYSNIAASVRHAQLAAEAGDGRGKFMVAFHSLTGQNPQPFDLDRIRMLLVEAKAAGVNKAQQYIDAVDESKRCREQAAFKLLGQPVFCYFRSELTQLLISKGMTERQKDLEQWTDIYRPGDILASADRADVIYDSDPKEELHRLARFVYVFHPEEGVERETLLRRVLTEKYGEPQAMEASKQVGGRSQWRLPDGVAIGLEKDADGNVSVHYTLPKRWEDRAAHLKRERELEQNARMMRDQVAL